MEAPQGTSRAMKKVAYPRILLRISRFLSITTQLFLPTSAQRLWMAMGCEGEVASWWDAVNWNNHCQGMNHQRHCLNDWTLMKFSDEQTLVEEGPEDNAVHGVKVERKKEENL